MHLAFQDYLMLLGPSLGLMGIMWRHSNAQFHEIAIRLQNLDEKLTNKIEQGDEKLAKEIKNLEEKLTKKIEQGDEKLANKIENETKYLERNLSEKITMLDNKLSQKADTVRDRISRIEGHLMPTKVIPFEVPSEETNSENEEKELKAHQA